MKSNRILIVLVSIVFSLSSFIAKAQYKSDLKTAELKDHVKAVYTQTYSATDKSGEIVKGDKISNDITQFNNKGLMTDDKSYRNNRLIKKIILKYGDLDNIVEFDFFRPDGSLYFIQKYNYNDKGKIAEENTIYTDSSYNVKKNYNYDIHSNLIERNTYDSKGLLTYKETYKYNSLMNETEFCKFSAEGSLIIKSTKNYDADGKLIDSKEESKKYVNKFTYDNRGNIITDEGYRNDSLISKRTYDIDFKGDKVAERTYYPNGKIKNKKLYDKEGNLSEDTDYNDLGTIKSSETIKYMYDMYGNWRTKTTTINSKITIAERSYEYY
jgi:hypothetical protein